jgi:hypothetical protein
LFLGSASTDPDSLIIRRAGLKQFCPTRSGQAKGGVLFGEHPQYIVFRKFIIPYPVKMILGRNQYIVVALTPTRRSAQPRLNLYV